MNCALSARSLQIKISRLPGRASIRDTYEAQTHVAQDVHRVRLASLCISVDGELGEVIHASNLRGLLDAKTLAQRKRTGDLVKVKTPQALQRPPHLGSVASQQRECRCP